MLLLFDRQLTYLEMNCERVFLGWWFQSQFRTSAFSWAALSLFHTYGSAVSQRCGRKKLGDLFSDFPFWDSPTLFSSRGSMASIFLVPSAKETFVFYHGILSLRLKALKLVNLISYSPLLFSPSIYPLQQSWFVSLLSVPSRSCFL